MSNEIATTEKKSLEQQVAEWSATDAILRAAVEATKGVTVAGHVDGPKKGREAVHKYLMDLVNLRTPIEKRRTELKRPILDLGNLVDAEAKRLTAIITPRENELRADRDAYDREQERIENEKKEAARLAAQKRVQDRLDALASAGLPPAIGPATDLDDAAWAEYLDKEMDAKALRDAAVEVSTELTALGDPCTVDEALALTIEQGLHRLEVARKANSDRREAQRIKDEEAARVAELERIEAERIEAERKAQAEAERVERERIAAEERAARERLERGAQRMRELALLGSSEDLDILADMTDEAWSTALAVATQDKDDRDRIAAEERRKADEQARELARMQQAEADRLEAERVAKERAEAEEAAAKEAAERKAARDAEAARIEALRPEMDKAMLWAHSITLPELPDVTGQVLADLQASRDRIAAFIKEETARLLLGEEKARLLPF